MNGNTGRLDDDVAELERQIRGYVEYRRYIDEIGLEVSPTEDYLDYRVAYTDSTPQWVKKAFSYADQIQDIRRKYYRESKS